MATPTNSISNLITVATFSGQSKFAGDFQTVLTRAVELQSLNLQSLQIQQQNETDRQTALQSVDSRLTTLQTAISNLSSSTGLSSYAATVSNSAVAGVSLSAGALAGSYSLEVTSLGSHEQAISSGSPQITDPNSQNLTSGPIALSVGGGAAVQISPTTNTLQGLATAINANPAFGVTASIVNVGSSNSPDYRLSLQATKLGNISINLSQGTVDNQGNVSPGTPLVSTLSQGSLASYYVDGLNQNPITSDSDTITLAPGVSVNLQQTNQGAPVTINVSQNTSSIQSALQAFATAYNNTVGQLAGAHGKNASALQGDSILFSANAALRSLNGYLGGNGNGLSHLGLDLDQSGHLTFNATEFQTTAAQGVSAITQWLGDSTSGFIQSATSAINSLEDPVSGAVKNEETQIAASLAKLSSNISNEVDRINNFQQNLVTQLSQSDAAIYQLQSQSTLYQGLFNTNNNNTNSH